MAGIFGLQCSVRPGRWRSLANRWAQLDGLIRISRKPGQDPTLGSQRYVRVHTPSNGDPVLKAVADKCPSPPPERGGRRFPYRRSMHGSRRSSHILLFKLLEEYADSGRSKWISDEQLVELLIRQRKEAEGIKARAAANEKDPASAQ